MEEDQGEKGDMDTAVVWLRIGRGESTTHPLLRLACRCTATAAAVPNSPALIT